jgi:hypothetical protein
MGWNPIFIVSAAICIFWIAIAIYFAVDVGQGVGRHFTVGDIVADSRRDRASYSK